MSQWFYMHNGQKHGPIDAAGLKQLAATGALSTTDLIWHKGLPKWVPASQVKGLFTAPAAAPHQPLSEANTLSEAEALPLPRTPNIPFLVGAGVVIVLIAALFAWFFTTRDTWEEGNRFEIIQRCQECTNLVGGGKPAEGIKKYEELLQFVGNHKLADPEVTKAMAAARAVQKPATQMIQEQRLSDLRNQEEQRLAEERQKEAEALAKKREEREVQIQAERRQTEEGIAARKRIITDAKVKLRTYYAGPLDAVIRQLDKVNKAAESSQYKDYLAWHKGYAQACETLLTLQQNKLREMPTFTKEDRDALGQTWEEVMAADAALATRINCASNLHFYVRDLLFQAINGEWLGAEGDIAPIMGNLYTHAASYFSQAAMHHKAIQNLLDHGLLDGWPARLQQEGLTCDARGIATECDAVIAAAKKDESEIARRRRTNIHSAASPTPSRSMVGPRPSVKVVCPQCGGTGLKSEQQLEAEVSATLSRKSRGTAKIDRRCPSCEGTGYVTK